MGKDKAYERLSGQNTPIDDRPRWLVLLLNFIGYLFPNRKKLSEYEAEIVRLEGLNRGLTDPRLLYVDAEYGGVLKMVMNTPIAHAWASFGLNILRDTPGANNYVTLRFQTMLHHRNGKPVMPETIDITIRYGNGFTPSEVNCQLMDDLHSLALYHRALEGKADHVQTGA